MNIKYNREDILDEGGKLIRLKGYHHTGINDIIQAAKISKGSFYSHFDSKEDFAKQLVERYGENQLKIIMYFLENEALSPVERLNQFYQSVIDYHIANNFKDGCLVNNLSVELGGSSDALGKLLDEQFMSWVGVIRTCIHKGQEIGEIRQNIPAGEMAELLHTSFYGALSRMKATANASPLELWRLHMFEFLRA